MIQQPADYSCCEGASSRFGQRNIATRRIDVTSSWGKSRSAYRTSLTMPARVKKFFCIFCSLFSFFGHTTPFTPKSGLIGSVKPELCTEFGGKRKVLEEKRLGPLRIPV